MERWPPILKHGILHEQTILTTPPNIFARATQVELRHWVAQTASRASPMQGPVILPVGAETASVVRAARKKHDKHHEHVFYVSSPCAQKKRKVSHYDKVRAGL